MTSQTAQQLDGKALAQKLNSELKERIPSLQAQFGRPPGLAVLMVGEDPASAIYVRKKERICSETGITTFGRHFPTDTPQQELERFIDELNQDERVDGILLQLPLPDHLDASTLLYRIDPDKDVDGLHPANLGRLVRSEMGWRSCTPAGVMRLLQEYQIDLPGKRAVVLGRSILVGKPMSLMLLEANATVSMAHSYTSAEDLQSLTRNADILVTAVGQPGAITKEMVKPGAVVVDVGISRLNQAGGKSRIVGDVDFEAVAEIAQFLTPVPGGVGPMTVAMLLQNTVSSYSQRASQKNLVG